MVKKRIILSMISAISLTFGLMIYLVLRKDTYFHGWLPQAFCDLIYSDVERNFVTDFLKYYLPDFLWAFSFSSALTAVTMPLRNKRLFFISLVVFTVGAAYETLQYFEIVDGTFDLFDILMYAVAALISAAINIKFFKGEEKI